MASRKSPASQALALTLDAITQDDLIRRNLRLVNVEGEIPELVSQMTVPYECTVCGGRVMLEHEIVERLQHIVGCPYCYKMRFVDDTNEHAPSWAR